MYVFLTHGPTDPLTESVVRLDGQRARVYDAEDQELGLFQQRRLNST